ncbi:MAG: polysaccharide deacetylase family protein [Bacteroidota bacterium]
MKRPIYLLLFWLMGQGNLTFGQETILKRLGYKEDDKLLIIHADDLGITHSANQASFEAINKGSVNSASIMPPTPWMAEVAHYVKAHPEHDFGIHLTLTSEWEWLKWGPVAPKSQVASLLDKHGYFYSNCDSLHKYAKVEEVEIELRAQIEQALKMGIKPTHLDSHMGCVFWGGPEYFSIYLQLAKEYQIPAMANKDLVQLIQSQQENPAGDSLISQYDILVDDILQANPKAFDNSMEDFYTQTLKSLKPGITVLIIHCAYDDRESQGMSYKHPYWGSKWRDEDTKYFKSEACKKLLKEEGIHLITWREIGKLINK